MQTSGWWPAFEHTWQWLMLDVRRRWAARAHDEGLTGSQRDYAERRAASLGRPYTARQEACETTGAVVKCGCRDSAGRRKEGVRWYACRRHLTCARCRIERSKRESTRIRHALEHHVERMRASDAGRPQQIPTLLLMVTVGVRHSGDVAVDRRHLAQSWRRFRDAYAHRFGAFPFVGTYEVTPGEDQRGHVHAHVLVMWKRGRSGDGGPGDWALVSRLWKDATRDDGAVVLISAVRRCGDAAGYVAKYVAKGVASSDFSGHLAAEVASATYNTRWVFTSRRFWLPFVHVCGSCGCKVERARFNFSSVGPPPAATDWSAIRGERAGPVALVLPGIPGPDKRASTSRLGVSMGGHGPGWR